MLSSQPITQNKTTKDAKRKTTKKKNFEEE